jgi:hypothetical protein
MIFHNVDQNTEPWLMLRNGIPTASEFDKILTPKKMEPSRQAADYMDRKIAEWIYEKRYGRPLLEEAYQSLAMQQGLEDQDKAVARYESLYETETAPGGFWTLDSELAGCSPDRMVGKDGVLEVKCPSWAKQVKGFFRGVEADHVAQIQGQLWICEREWIDVYCYGELKLPAKRIHRDEKFIKPLAEAVTAFIELMLRMRQDIEREQGPFLREPEPGSEVDLITSPTVITEADLDEIIRMRREQQGAR